MEDLVDKTAPVRPGEELDLDAVKKFLEAAAPELSGEISLEQFPSGHSNLTYMLKVGDRELVLRRPPFGSKVKSAHDMSREYRILSAIHKVYDPAPRPLAFNDDDSVIGFASDEPSEPLLEFKDSFGKLEIVKGVSSFPVDLFDACFYQRSVGNSKGQPDDNHV